MVVFLNSICGLYLISSLHSWWILEDSWIHILDSFKKRSLSNWYQRYLEFIFWDIPWSFRCLEVNEHCLNVQEIKENENLKVDLSKTTVKSRSWCEIEKIVLRIFSRIFVILYDMVVFLNSICGLYLISSLHSWWILEDSWIHILDSFKKRSLSNWYQRYLEFIFWDIPWSFRCLEVNEHCLNVQEIKENENLKVDLSKTTVKSRSWCEIEKIVLRIFSRIFVILYDMVVFLNSICGLYLISSLHSWWILEDSWIHILDYFKKRSLSNWYQRYLEFIFWDIPWSFRCLPNLILRSLMKLWTLAFRELTHQSFQKTLLEIENMSKIVSLEEK